MSLRIGWSVILSLVMVVPAMAQTHPLRGPASSGGATRPDQPVRPRTPTLVRRAPRSPQPPFTQTPQAEARVDRVLNLWEQRNRNTKTFDCRFTRLIYDLVFSPPKPNEPLRPKFVEIGVLKYAAPDRGLFRIEMADNNGKEVPIEDARAEHWICDGKSIFEYKPAQKQLIQHKLPPDLQGTAITNTPLPFLFGAEAKKLKQRYFIRLVTPANVKDQIWLEAYPRYQQDAANFHHAQFIISTKGMSPFALKLIQPNQKDYTVYRFFDIVVNDPLRLFKDPFRAYTPLGWQKIVEEPPAAQARRTPDRGQR